MELSKPTNSSLDYTPCSDSNGEIVCDQVPLEEVQKAIMRNTLPRLASIKLILQPGIFTETIIPQDVFGEKQILRIGIEFPLVVVENRSLLLQVDDDAFRSTKGYTKIFRIGGVDCTQLDLSFLSGFDKLTEFTFSNIYNIQHCLPSASNAVQTGNFVVVGGARGNFAHLQCVTGSSRNTSYSLCMGTCF